MNAADLATLRALCHQPVAALATLHDGEPAVSMVPFVLLPAATAEGLRLVIHISQLAAHTRDLQVHPRMALMITADPQQADSVLALSRLSMTGVVTPCPPEHPDYTAARAAYLTKLPDSAELFSFGDFALYLITPDQARYVAGFGRAMTLTPQQLAVTASFAAPPDTTVE